MTSRSRLSPRAAAGDARRHRFGDQRPVRHRRAHQREAGDLAGEEQPRHADRFVLVRDRRQVAAVLQVAERQRDGVGRAGSGAQAVADAARAVHDHRLAVGQRQHPILRTRPHTGTAADAVGEVDLRVLQPRAMAAEFARLRPLGEGVAAVRELDAASHHRGDDDDQQHERDGEDEQVHDARFQSPYRDSRAEPRGIG
jgi:hypothetical protein